MDMVATNAAGHGRRAAFIRLRGFRNPLVDVWARDTKARELWFWPGVGLRHQSAWQTRNTELHQEIGPSGSCGPVKRNVRGRLLSFPLKPKYSFAGCPRSRA